MNIFEYSNICPTLIYNLWHIITVTVDLWRDRMTLEILLVAFSSSIQHPLLKSIFFFNVFWPFEIIFFPVQSQSHSYISNNTMSSLIQLCSLNKFLLKNGLFLPSCQRHLESKISNTLLVLHPCCSTLYECPRKINIFNEGHGVVCGG